MTIEDTLKENGITINCEVTLHHCGDVIVYFYNTEDARADSTSFDVVEPLTKAGEQELSNLYSEFCKENKISCDTVEEIHLNHVAESMDELALIC